MRASEDDVNETEVATILEASAAEGCVVRDRGGRGPGTEVEAAGADIRAGTDGRCCNVDEP